VLEAGVAAEVAAVLAADGGVGALVLPERAFGAGFWAASRIFEKELYLGDSRVEAARAFRREAFARAGGYDETMWAFEDWDLPDRVAAQGWRIGRTQAGVWHDEGRVRLHTAFVKKRYYGRSAAGYLARSCATRRPLGRSALVRRPDRLLRSPLRSAGLAVLKTTEAAGFLAGVLSARSESPGG
jgi:GT2 family glycosyltransferase